MTEQEQADILNNILEKKESEQKAYEFFDLLEIAKLSYSVPTKTAPTAQRRQLYLEKESTFSFSKLFPTAKFAIFGAILFFVGATAFTTFASFSLPGQRLYSFKKAAEQIHVAFVTNSNNKAELQLNLAQKRLTEASEIINSNQKNPKITSAALEELAVQTKNTVQSFKTLVAQSGSEKNSQLPISRLDELTKSQEELIAKVKPEVQTKQATETALNNAKAVSKTLAEIKQLVAASQEQEIANLNGPLVITGIVSSINNGELIVDKELFLINSKTEVKKNGVIIEQNNIITKDKVTITGIRNSVGSLVATEIIVFPNEQTKTEVNLPTEKKSSTAENKETKQIENSYQKTSTKFIPEDPSPQYVP